uniref:GMP synthase - Glutamine amidotransferase n=1 Tax=Candidatus Kentrum sp. DK TaxID=2126562 RepID=A0A450SIZ7_9GAMM|nr:MAG: GMP synthase - Glutamine amidotransferase [Candidatus Kentron sp. DK]
MILCFRHVACEGPGYLEEALRKRAIPFRLVRIDEGESVPDTLEGVSGLVFMGGPMSVNDPLPWIKKTLALIRTAVGESLPVLGHCLGGQLIARALGARVTGNPVKEIGWLPVAVRADAQDNPGAAPWIKDVPPRFEAFHWHGETFGIPEGATPILESLHCAHQGFVLGNVLALQCHVEVTPDMVREWARLYAHELTSPTETVQSAEAMQQNLEARVAALHRIADGFYGAWFEAVRVRTGGREMHTDR